MTESVQVLTEFLDHGWRKSGRRDEVSGFVVNRWRRGAVLVTVAWCSDTAVSHAVVQLGDGPMRQIDLSELLPVVTSKPATARGLRLVNGVSDSHRSVCSVAWPKLTVRSAGRAA